MKNIPILNLIKHIKTKYGTKAINHYLNKEYPNKKYHDWKLWEYLKNATSKRNSAYPLESNIIDRKIFKIVNTPDNKKHPRVHAVSRLFQKMKMFTVKNYLSERKLILEWLFIKSIQEESPEIYLQALVRFESILKSETVKNDELYNYIAHQYYWEKYRLDNATGKPQLADLNLSKSYLQKWYTQRVGLLNIELKTRNQTLGEKSQLLDNEFTNTKMNELLIAVKQIDLKNNKSFDTCIEVLKELQEIDNFELFTLTPLLENIISQSTTAYREGNHYPLIQYWNVFFDLSINKGILLENGKLAIMQYMNFLSIFSVMQNEDLDQFAIDLLSYISDNDEHIAIHFKDIFIAFNNKDFETVLSIIHKNEQDVKIQNLHYLKLRIHTFKIRSNYELETFHYWKHQTPVHALNNSIRSFRSYLKNSDLDDSKKEGASNFIKIITKIYRTPNVEELNKLEIQVRAMQPIIHQNWLLKKIKEAIQWHQS